MKMNRALAAWMMAGMLALVADVVAQPMTPPRAETSYQQRQPRRPGVPETAYDFDRSIPVFPESGYDAGLVTKSEFGLMATDGSAQAFRNLIPSLQVSAGRATGRTWNVSPITAKAIDAQLSFLQTAGATRYILYVTNAEEARRFALITRSLELPIVAIVSAPIEGLNLPQVVDPPTWGEPMAQRIAARFPAKDSTPTVWRVTSRGLDPAVAAIAKESLQKGLAIAYKAPRLIDADPAAGTEPKESPDVICILGDGDSLRFAPVLRQRHPKAMILVSGNAADLTRLMLAGACDVIVQSDAFNIAGACVKQLDKPAVKPIVVKPTALPPVAANNGRSNQRQR